MPRLSHKGISTPPKTIEVILPHLFAWLSKLQLVFPNVSTYEASIDLASINATTYSTQTFTVVGLTTEDVIMVNPPALAAGLYLLSYRVSAADTLSLTFYNSNGGAINEAAATYKIMACKL
jgi:methionine-rich copper-binding protein CopC